MKHPENLVWTPEMVKNFWDYQSLFPEQYFTYRHSTEIARQISPFLAPGSQVLDYGCGPGYLMEKLMQRGFPAAGLDFSAATLNAVRKTFGKIPAFLGAYTLQELRDSGMHFDAATVIEVVEHLYDAQLQELLQTLKSLLKPGGVAVFSTPNNELLEKSMVLCPVSNQLFHRWQHVRSWSAESLSACLRDNGFDIVKTFSTNFSVSLHIDHSRQPLKDTWQALRRKIKDRFKRHSKKPHLVVIARSV
ncbi:MAG: class I SAM-dependent methyltransferase [Gammaproteobacteria bacterium]